MSDRTYPASHPHITWMGRTWVSDEGSVRLGFPGITLAFITTATRVALRLHTTSPDCYLDITIDDEPPRRLRLAHGDTDTVIAEGLAAHHAHRVTVLRRTESWMGHLTIHAILLTAGDLLPTPAAPARPRLLFIGDSITCGAGVESPAVANVDEPGNHALHHAGRSFAMEVGRRLDADVHLISYGGRGLVRDWQGLGNDVIANAPVFFERVLPDDAQPTWDHATYQPQVVIIGLGTNDFNQDIPDEATWSQAYAKFIARIRDVHPQARILLTNSPMLSMHPDHNSYTKAISLEAFLTATLALCARAGDTQVERLRYRHQPGSASNSHPTAAQHQFMADDLQPILSAYLR